MSLTMGRAPFGQQRSGRFNFDPPEKVVYVEDYPRRVSARKNGETVLDSHNVMMVHETGRLARYSFPRDDVSLESHADRHVEGFVQVAWSAAEEWFEEDEQVFVHPKDPYHRIDVLSISRSVRVSINDIVLAESSKLLALYETGLPIRYYIPPRDVHTDVLIRSDTVTECAYKGTATHWSGNSSGSVLNDLAWTYEEPNAEVGRIEGHFCFYNERVDLDVDGLRQERPRTAWSK